MELTVVCHILSIISCNQVSPSVKTLFAIKENLEQVIIKENIRPEHPIKDGKFSWIIKICFNCKENEDKLYSENVS